MERWNDGTKAQREVSDEIKKQLNLFLTIIYYKICSTSVITIYVFCFIDFNNNSGIFARINTHSSMGWKRFLRN